MLYLPIPPEPTAPLIPHRSYVGWAGSFLPAAASLQLGIPTQLAKCLNLPEQTIVRLSLIPASLTTASITVIPVTSDDWEILSLNASTIEYHLLEQIQIISHNSAFPFYINQQQLIHLKLTESTTSQQGFARLILSSQVIVAPKPRDTNNQQQAQHISEPLSTPLPKRFKLRVQEPMVGIAEDDPQQATAAKQRKELLNSLCPRHIYVSELTLKSLQMKEEQLVLLRHTAAAAGRRQREAEAQRESLHAGDSASSTLATPSATVCRIAHHPLVHPGHLLLPSLLAHHLQIPHHSIVVDSSIAPYQRCSGH